MKKYIVSLLTLSFLISPIALAETFYKDSSGKIWALQNDKRREIRSQVILNSYDEDGTLTIKSISDLALARIPINNLVRVKGTNEVYALNDLGYKRWIQNPDIFNSYNLSWDDVADITETEMVGYQDCNLVKEVNSDTVYYLNGTMIQPIRDLATFQAIGFNWRALQVINAEDLATYTLGEKLTYEAPSVVLEQPIYYSSEIPTPTLTPTPTPTQTPIPEPTPTPKPIVKNIEVIADSMINQNGKYFNIEIRYTEDDNRKDTEVSVSAPSGYFLGYNCTGGEPANAAGDERKGNSLTCSMGKSGRDGKPALGLQFMASEKATPIVVDVNGFTKEITLD